MIVSVAVDVFIGVQVGVEVNSTTVVVGNAVGVLVIVDVGVRVGSISGGNAGTLSVAGGVVSPPQPTSPTVKSSANTNKPVGGSLPPFFRRRQFHSIKGPNNSPPGFANTDAASGASGFVSWAKNCPVCGSK